MKLRLPFTRNKPDGKESSKPKEKLWLGGFLDLGNRKLTNEKSASSKLLEAYNGWVYINVSVLAEEVSKLELKLYQTRYENGELQLAEIETHEILDLLDRFNETTTMADAIYLTEAHQDLAGDCFWYLANQDQAGKPSDIFILRPDKITVDLGDITDSSRRLVEGYTYKDTVDGKPIEIKYDPEDILPFKTPNPSNPYRGKSTVEAISNDIDIDTLAGQTLREFFENGMIVQFALSTDQRLNNDQIENFQSQMRSAYGGAKNAWKVPIFGGGVKPVELQMSSKDMELIGQMQWLRDKIMLAFKNTPASLGIVEDVNRANAESSILTWKQTVIEPKMKRIVDNLNEFLVPRYGDNLVLGFESPVPEDDKADIDKAIQLYKGGLLTKNEARGLIDYDDVSGGDDFTSSGFNPITSPAELPKALKNVDWKRAFRKNIFKDYTQYKKFFDSELPNAKRYLKSKKPIKVKQVEAPVVERPKYSFTLEQVDKYAANQLKIADMHEQIFAGRLVQLILSIVEDGISHLDSPDARKSGKLVDKKYWVNESINKLEPVLDQVLIQAGNQANNLLNIDEPYIPKSIKAINTEQVIREQIKKFATSMIDTDVDLMVAILADGLAEELSIAQIRKQITDRFSEYSKMQAEKITRTEVIKVSNLGAQDAFEQSGVVEAKQWLATEDDRTDEECAELDGQIIGLEDDYLSVGDEFKGHTIEYADVPYPPLHPNCRCVILPVLEDAKLYTPDIKSLKDRVQELESQIDKRKKAFRDLKAQSLDDQAYIKALEKYTGSDEPIRED